MSSSSTFLLFENFDFEKDKAFQTGWAALNTLIDGSKADSEFLRAKAFFFSKHVCKFDFPKYLEWKERKREHSTDGKPSSHVAEGDSGESGPSVEVPPPTTNSGCTDTKELNNSDPKTIDSMKSSAATGIVFQKGSSVSNIEELSNKISELYSESENSSSSIKEMETERDLSDNDKLSLLDIADLIQNNKPIPGVLTLDVKPTNSDPTPSVMVRMKKPWEVERTGSVGEADDQNGIDINDCIEDSSVVSDNIRLSSEAIN